VKFSATKLDLPDEAISSRSLELDVKHRSLGIIPIDESVVTIGE
jgi:hypothetical protein